MLSLLTLAALPLVALAQYGDYPAASSSTMMKASATAAASSAAMASSAPSMTAAAPPAIQTVIVGGGPLVYNPSSVTAVVGSKIFFQFEFKNHTVAQSTFATPCQYAMGGLNSGYVPAVAGGPYPNFTITVTDVSAPLWFYCAQGAHCTAGMVFAINPTPAQSIDMFIANAKAGANATIGATSLSGMGVKADSAAMFPPANATSTAAAVMGSGTSMSSMAGSATSASVIPAAATTSKTAGATQVVVGGVGLFLVGLVGLML